MRYACAKFTFKSYADGRRLLPTLVPALAPLAEFSANAMSPSGSSPGREVNLTFNVGLNSEDSYAQVETSPLCMVVLPVMGHLACSSVW